MCRSRFASFIIAISHSGSSLPTYKCNQFYTGHCLLDTKTSQCSRSRAAPVRHTTRTGRGILHSVFSFIHQMCIYVSRSKHSVCRGKIACRVHLIGLRLVVFRIHHVSLCMYVYICYQGRLITVLCFAFSQMAILVMYHMRSSQRQQSDSDGSRVWQQ